MSPIFAMSVVKCLLLLCMTTALARPDEDGPTRSNPSHSAGQLTTEQIKERVSKVQKPDVLKGDKSNADAFAMESMVAVEEDLEEATPDDDIGFEKAGLSTKRSFSKHQRDNDSPEPSPLSPSPKTDSVISSSPIVIEPTMPLHERPRHSLPEEPKIEIMHTQSVDEDMEQETTNSEDVTTTMTVSKSRNSTSHAVVATLLTLGTVLFASVTALYVYRLWYRMQMRRYRGWRPYEFELTDM